MTVRTTLLALNSTAVLILEDDAEFAGFLVEVCEDYGFSAAWAKSPADLWHRLARERYDVVVVELSDRDDAELFGRLRTQRPDLALVATTAFGSAARRALAAGALSCVKKPFHPEDLISTIGRVLEARGSTRRDGV